jgi:hypothetical protein
MALTLNSKSKLLPFVIILENRETSKLLAAWSKLVCPEAVRRKKCNVEHATVALFSSAALSSLVVSHCMSPTSVFRSRKNAISKVNQNENQAQSTSHSET